MLAFPIISLIAELILGRVKPSSLGVHDLDGLYVIWKDHVPRRRAARPLLPHKDVLLPHGLLDGFQGCPDHNTETKMRMFL
jgi:hypothetical protein